MLRSVLNLGKAGISFSVALTAATGYLLSIRVYNPDVLFVFIGVLLLAMAASALNQVQEREADNKMLRTQKRPLLNGNASFRLAILMITVFSLSGFLILYVYFSLLPALLGLGNLLWYNFVYTPLKYKTAFAAFPGGIVGAVPPVIGWTAGGGHIMHVSALTLALFFFIGQIPHFWILILKYSSEYKKAGIKTIAEKFSVKQIKRLVFSWVVATAASGSLLSYYLIINHNPAFYFLQALSASLIIYFIYWLGLKNNHHSYKAFLSINIYYLVVMIVLIADLMVV